MNTLQSNLLPSRNAEKGRAAPKKPALFSRLADALAAPADALAAPFGALSSKKVPAAIQMKEYKIDLGGGSSSGGGGGGGGAAAANSASGGSGSGSGGGGGGGGSDADAFGEFAGATTNSSFNPTFGLDADADVQSFLAEVDTTSDV